MAASGLTAEQLERIARNRAEAMRRMALRQQRQGLLENREAADGGKQISGLAISGSRSEGAISARPGRVPLSRAVVACVENGPALPSHHEDGPTRYPAPPVLSPTRVIISYRDEQPSTSTTVAAPILAAGAENRRFLGTSLAKGAAMGNVHLKKYSVKVIFKLVDSKSFEVQFKPFCQSIVLALKEIPSKIYNPEKKAWFFPVEDICSVEKALQMLEDVELDLEKISDYAIKTLQTYGGSDNSKEPILVDHIESTLVDALFPYQRRGVIYGIKRRGRLLLADEMGLGKSVQALGIARYFKCDWPLLIICPSSVKFSWLNQLETFLPGVTDVVLIEKGSDHLPEKKTNRTVVIMSYDLMVSKRSHIIEYDFRAIIFDESHLLKDCHAQRTKTATDISRRALRVILLTGTPALSRPAELFSQVRIIDPKIFPNYRDFAIRYCDGKQGKYSFEAKGCTNSDELSVILLGSVMLRRLKKDVLNDLPMKRQEVVYLKDDSIYTNIANLRKANAAFSGASDKDTKHQRLVEYYYETGIAKAKSVARYIIEHYFYDGAPKRKVLVFAHHQVVLDSISMDVAKKGLRSVRIDGSTASRSRDEQCRLFQENDDVVVAVLSMTAAGIGITLTAASVVVFAELHWNPGTLKQAEDRAHRVGQKDSVFVQYLIANGTADDILWPLIQKKLDVLQSCKLSADTYRGAGSVQAMMGPESGGLEDYFPKTKRVRPNAV